MRTPLRIALIFIFALAGSGFAQTTTQTPHPPPFTSVPPVESVDLYYSFFNYHQGLITAMAAAATANPASSAQLNQQMATLLQVDVKELPIVIANTQQVTQSYAKLESDRKAGSFAVPKDIPALTPTQQASVYDFQKIHLTNGAVVTLFRQLSVASWKGLHGYVVGAYKTTIYKP